MCEDFARAADLCRGIEILKIKFGGISFNPPEKFIKLPAQPNSIIFKKFKVILKVIRLQHKINLNLAL